MNRNFGIASALLAALLVAPGLVAAQAYPSKPIRIIVPFPPGGATDIAGRYLAQKFGESFGQQGIVDNRGGANGTIGLELAAKAPPDGYTLVVGQAGNLAISPALTKVGYDPVRDFAPISLMMASPHAFAVHPSVPVRNFKEAVAFVRARPGQLNFASTGSGSAGHIGMEILKKATNMNITHVPYKGAAQGLTDLAAGQVMLMFTSVLSTETIRRAGKVRVLATGGSQRATTLPGVPTIAESGFPGFEIVTWWGLLGQAAMPKEVVARLHGEFIKIMASPDAQKRIGSLGAELKTSTPEQFAAYIRSERQKWGQGIRESGARVD